MRVQLFQLQQNTVTLPKTAQWESNLPEPKTTNTTQTKTTRYDDNAEVSFSLRNSFCVLLSSLLYLTRVILTGQHSGAVVSTFCVRLEPWRGVYTFSVRALSRYSGFLAQSKNVHGVSKLAGCLALWVAPPLAL